MFFRNKVSPNHLSFWVVHKEQLQFICLAEQMVGDGNIENICTPDGAAPYMALKELCEPNKSIV